MHGLCRHGHVTAVTVAPTHRQLGCATRLMRVLEAVSEHAYNAFYVDLYVRKSNEVGVGMYRRMGYAVYRRVIQYYQQPDEDALDMRKALPRDPDKLSEQPGKDCHPHELAYP